MGIVKRVVIWHITVLCHINIRVSLGWNMLIPTIRPDCANSNVRTSFSRFLDGDLIFFLNVYLFILKERGRVRILNRLPAVSTEPEAVLDLTNRKIMT